MKVCPYCAEKIQEEAAKCRFCGEWLDPAKRPAWSLDFAALGEQLGKELSEASERGALGPEALASLRAALEDKLGATAPAKPAAAASKAPAAASSPEREPTQEGSAAMGGPGPSPAWAAMVDDGGGQVSAWEPPTWLAPGAPAGEPGREAPAAAAASEPAPSTPPVERSEAPTRPEGPTAANEEPAPQFVPPGRAATAAAVQSEPAPEAADPVRASPRATAVPPTSASGEIQLPNERASLEEVAARMERLKATADAVQRTLAEKAAERSASGLAAAQGTGAATSGSQVPSQPAVERHRSGTLLQGARVPGPADGSSSVGSPSSSGRKRGGTMDRLEQSILGEDRDEFGDLDSEGSGFGSTSFGDAISARRPLPWGPIALGLLVVGVIGYFMFRDSPTVNGEPVAQGQTQGDTNAAPEPPPDDTAAPAAETGEPAPEAGDATGETGEPAADSGEPAADDGGADDGAADDTGAADGGTAPAPADEALTEKLAEAEKAYKRRKYEAALAAIDEAMAMSPNHPDALVLLANVQLEQGEMDAALASANKCVGIDPAKADCWLTIAALEEAGERPAKALVAWRKYVEHAPDGRYASSAKKAIKRLEKQVEG